MAHLGVGNQLLDGVGLMGEEVVRCVISKLEPRHRLLCCVFVFETKHAGMKAQTRCRCCSWKVKEGSSANGG